MGRIRLLLIASILMVCTCAILSQTSVFYYWRLRMVTKELSRIPGVKVLQIWKNEDITLEDCSVLLRVRKCTPVRVHFCENQDWMALFERIDGIIIRGPDTVVKTISIKRLLNEGISALNLRNILDGLESVLDSIGTIDSDPSVPQDSSRWLRIDLMG